MFKWDCMHMQEMQMTDAHKIIILLGLGCVYRTHHLLKFYLIFQPFTLYTYSNLRMIMTNFPTFNINIVKVSICSIICTVLQGIQFATNESSWSDCHLITQVNLIDISGTWIVLLLAGLLSVQTTLHWKWHPDLSQADKGPIQKIT